MRVLLDSIVDVRGVYGLVWYVAVVLWGISKWSCEVCSITTPTLGWLGQPLSGQWVLSSGCTRPNLLLQLGRNYSCLLYLCTPLYSMDGVVCDQVGWAQAQQELGCCWVVFLPDLLGIWRHHWSSTGNWMLCFQGYWYWWCRGRRSFSPRKVVFYQTGCTISWGGCSFCLRYSREVSLLPGR